MTGDRRQWYTGGVQLGRHGQLLRARHEEQVLVMGNRYQHTQVDGVRHRRLVGSAAAEPFDQLGTRYPYGLLVGPRSLDLRGQAEDPAEAAARVPGLQKLLDGGEGVAAVEEVGDLAQPRQVRVAVHVGAAAPLGAREESAVLVGADVAHGRARGPGELVDAVLAHRASTTC